MQKTKIEANKMYKVKPFIRYVGGKRWFVNKFSELLPNEINNYFEPFLGSGSIFFYLKQNDLIKNSSTLSDLNKNLIITFLQVAINPEEVSTNLSKIQNTKEKYYEIRGLRPSDELNKAIYYLYLNRTSFGGIYRVNKAGDFNVPYGNRVYKKMIDCDNLMNCSRLLKNDVTLLSSCFSEINFEIESNDFFCIDPPYLCDETKFNRYNDVNFSFTQMDSLINLLERINRCDAKFLLFIGNNMNFANKIKHLGKVITLNRQNNLSTKVKGKIEIIIKNY